MGVPLHCIMHFNAYVNHPFVREYHKRLEYSFNCRVPCKHLSLKERKKREKELALKREKQLASRRKQNERDKVNPPLESTQVDIYGQLKERTKWEGGAKREDENGGVNLWPSENPFTIQNEPANLSLIRPRQRKRRIRPPPPPPLPPSLPKKEDLPPILPVEINGGFPHILPPFLPDVPPPSSMAMAMAMGEEPSVEILNKRPRRNTRRRKVIIDDESSSGEEEEDVDEYKPDENELENAYNEVFEPSPIAQESSGNDEIKPVRVKKERKAKPPTSTTTPQRIEGKRAARVKWTDETDKQMVEFWQELFFGKNGEKKKKRKRKGRTKLRGKEPERTDISKYLDFILLKMGSSLNANRNQFRRRWKIVSNKEPYREMLGIKIIKGTPTKLRIKHLTSSSLVKERLLKLTMNKVEYRCKDSLLETRHLCEFRMNLFREEHTPTSWKLTAETVATNQSLLQFRQLMLDARYMSVTSFLSLFFFCF